MALLWFHRIMYRLYTLKCISLSGLDVFVDAAVLFLFFNPKAEVMQLSANVLLNDLRQQRPSSLVKKCELMYIICHCDYIWTDSWGPSVYSSWVKRLSENALKMIHFNPKLHVRANESRKIQDLIQIETSWVFAVWWFPQWEHKKPVGGTKLSTFQSDKRQLCLFTSLHAAIKNRTEPRQMCFHGRWERGDPVIPPRRELKLAAASPTPVPHLNLRLRLSSLHASAQKKGGVGLEWRYLVEIITHQGEYGIGKTEWEPGTSKQWDGCSTSLSGTTVSS